MEDKGPFSYPPLTYLWVIGVASFAGVVRYLNHMETFSVQRFLIDVLSSAFTGLVTFWLCEWTNITGPMSAVLIAISGLLGSRAWGEFENLYRLRLLSLETNLTHIKDKEKSEQKED